MANPRERRAAAADGMVCRHDADGQQAPGRGACGDRVDCANVPGRRDLSRFCALAVALGNRAKARAAKGRSNSSFDPATLAKFEEATGALPRDLNATSARAAWIRRNRLVDWVEFKCKVVSDFVCEARKALKDAKGRRGAWSLRRAGRQRADRAVDRPAHQDLAPVGRLDRADALPQHPVAAAGWVASTLAAVVKVAGRKTLPVLQADSNRDPADVADWGPPMSDADWSETLSQVAARPDIGGLIVFPGTALIGGRGASLRAMLAAER